MGVLGVVQSRGDERTGNQCGAGSWKFRNKAEERYRKRWPRSGFFSLLGLLVLALMLLFITLIS